MGKWLPSKVKKEIKEDKKAQAFLDAQKEANRYANESIEKALDKIQAQLLAGDGMTWVWTKESAKEMLGQELALAYAHGFIDALSFKKVSRIIT